MIVAFPRSRARTREPWFAWYPVKTEDGHIVFWQKIWREWFDGYDAIVGIVGPKRWRYSL